MKALISVKDNNVYNTVYCSSNGFLDEVGYNLLNYYTDIETIKDLISYGNIYKLGKKYNRPEGYVFHKKTNIYTVFYIRDLDCDEKFNTPNIKSFRPILADHRKVGIVYVFENNKWYVETNKIKYQELTKDLIRKG